VLDDGFQHLRLRRDLDIVMLDSLNPFGNGMLFPRGTLREPVESLRRARVIALSRTDLCGAEALRALRESLAGKFPEALVIECRHRPVGLVSGGGTMNCSELKGRRVAAFCGIGNPEGFRKTLESLGADIAAFDAFPDHHVYSPREIAEITGRTSGTKADLIVTTEKDLARLPSGSRGGLMTLKVVMEVTGGLAEFESLLERTVPGPGAGTGNGGAAPK
jgi:tetraacyldisaccharide 4'-kinase